MRGCIKKMVANLGETVQYNLPVGDERIYLNDFIGKDISIKFTGNIVCIGCGTKIKKSYQQGFCYPCTKKLACCDLCILKPELCHFHKGTCREPSWGEKNCFIPHYVYLANTSDIKIGITRHNQIPTRWIDQGAIQALPIYKVKSRRISGLIEKIFASHISDKTNWRNLLKFDATKVDLYEVRNELIKKCQKEINDLEKKMEDSFEYLEDGKVIEISYPIIKYNQKITSYNLDKKNEIKDVLIGIKGQYLMFENGVLNARKYTGYEIIIE